MKKFLRWPLWIVGLLLLIHFEGVGQSTVITGRVVAASDNAPLPGVTVAVRGDNRGTVTDVDGKYSITAQPSDVLVFSFIGMETQEITVGNQSTVDVALAESSQSLQEIVVVGYGEQKKTNLTGAVSSVDTKVLESRPIADAARGLQGTTPGLNIVIPSGEIGSDPLIRIRGQFGSISGGASPLILLDNVEIPSLQLVNPDDIESISVLKDAASASIYGAKAAFGVILITTKKGAHTEGVKVTYSGNASFQNISKKMEMAGVDGMEYVVNAFERVGSTAVGALGWYVTRDSWERAVEWQEKWGDKVKATDPMVFGRDWYVDENNRKTGVRVYDPYEFMIREWAPTQTHNLAISGLSGKTNYNIGLGFLDQTSIVKPAKKDDFQRYNGSVQIGTEVNKWLKVNAGTLYSKRIKSFPFANPNFTTDPWLYVYRWGPTFPWGSEDGHPLRSPAFEMANANTATMQHNYASLNGGLLVTPVKNWTIKFDFTHANQDYLYELPGTRFTAKNTWATFASEKYDENGQRVYVDETGAVVAAGAPGAIPAYEFELIDYTGSPGAGPDHISRSASNAQWNTINLHTTYDLSLDDVHNFKFMAGMNRVGYRTAFHQATITALSDITNPQFRLATGTQTVDGNEYWDAQLGFFGRINYNFNEKYLLEANLRYDGTSKFPKHLWWRWFPSFSAGWRVSQEPWMDWASSTLDEFKIRASWGSIGDQSVPNSLYIPTMSGGFNSWLLGGSKLYQFGTPVAVSSSVTWQDITTLDIGADIRLFNGALGASFDWFRRDTENMIVPQEGIPPTYGTGAPRSNFGSLRTKGFEIQLDYSHSFDNGLQLNFVATFADAVTKITKYGTTKSIDSWYVGKTYGEIWGYETDRLYQAGDFVYEDGELVQVQSEDGFTVNQLADPNAATQGYLQSGNFYFGPGDVKFKDLNGDGVINPGNRLIDDHGDLKVIGNSTPRYEYGFRTGASFKGFDLNVFLQGVGKREIWGSGFLAIPGFNIYDGAMPQAIAGDFWREDRTDAFYPRPYDMGGANTGLNMQVQSRYLLNMAYLRFKNITLGYTIPGAVTERIDLNKVRFYVSLENFFTFDKLGGLPIDPEEVPGYSLFHESNYGLGRTGVGVPTFKSASVGVQLSF